MYILIFTIILLVSSNSNAFTLDQPPKSPKPEPLTLPPNVPPHVPANLPPHRVGATETPTNAPTSAPTGDVIIPPLPTGFDSSLSLLHTTEKLKGNYPCLSTNDCLQSNYSQGKWCKSGVVCIQLQCHVIHGYPCDQFQICNESQRVCLPRTCSKDSDCDDGLYCNGNEKCDTKTSLCLPSIRPVKCIGGECNETLKQCVFVPKMVFQWETYTTTGSLSLKTTNIQQERQRPLIITKQDAVFSVNSHTNSTGNTLTNTQITIIAALVILFFGITLFVLLLMMFMRAGVTSNTFVYTQSAE